MESVCKMIKAESATDFISRLIGLVFTSESADRVLYFPMCSRIHTFFMKYAIDIYYLDSECIIIAQEALGPGQFGSTIKNASSILECKAGLLKNYLNIGDHVIFQ